MGMMVRLITISICIGSLPGFASPLVLHNDNLKLKIYLDNFQAISCDETGNLCIAVGLVDNSQNVSRQIYKTQDAGFNWSSPISLLPVTGETKNDNYSASISCDSSGQRCILVSTTMIGTYLAPVVYRTSDGGLSWSDPTVLTLPSAAQNQIKDIYAGVSCNGSGSSCMIAGTLISDTKSFPMLYTTKNAGQQWSLVTTLKEPDGTLDHISSLYGISCDHSGLFCMAVGYAFTRNSFWSSPSSKPLVYTTEDGGASWSNPVVLPKDNSSHTASVLNDVACSASGRQCTALGYIYDVNTELTQPYFVTTTNGGVDWEKQTLVAKFDERAFLYSLDCDATGMSCTAVGFQDSPDVTMIKPIIYSTTDGAKTWVRNTEMAFPPYSGLLADIFCSKIDASCISVGIQMELAAKNLRGTQKQSYSRAFLPPLFKPEPERVIK